MIRLVFLCAFLSSTLMGSDVYYVGHSLVNHDMPRIVKQVALDLQQNHSYREAIINGSSLRYHWNNPALAEGGANVTVDLPGGQYGTLVLTEQVPVQTSFTWNSPVAYATQFINLAKTNRPNLAVYLYETWPHRTNMAPRPWVQSTWEGEIQVDLGLFEQAADQLSPLLQTPVLIVPGGLAIKRIRDEIALGNLPGITDFAQLFVDDIHLNAEGNYYMAMVFYSTFYRASPLGATGRILNQYGGVYVDVPQARKLKYQELAWDVVSNYPRSGAGQNTNSPTVEDDDYTYTSQLPTAEANLVGYWGFEEQSGTTTESGVGPESGQLVNFAANQIGVAGKLGRALYFDGTDNHVNFQGTSILKPTAPFTICAWYKGIPTTRGPILSSGFNYGSRRGIRLEASERTDLVRPRALAGNGSTLIQLNGSAQNADQWYHQAVTFDGRYLRLYIDGVMITRRSLQSLSYDASKPVVVGAEPGSGFYFKGVIDELRAYSRALSGQELTAAAQDYAQLTVAAPGVLGNDVGVSLAASLVQAPTNGQLELDANGGFRYRPYPGYSGADQFTYQATDGNGESATATVHLTIQLGNFTEVE